MPTHNRCGLLRRAVDSVLSQTCGDFELIVVDDASTDDTPAYLSSLAKTESRVRVLSNDRPSGACVSRNRAILASRGEFVTGLDDDDLFKPDHLDSLWGGYVRHAAEGSVGAVFARIITRTMTGDALSRSQRLSVTFADLTRKNVVGNQVYGPKEIFLRAGLFDEKLPAWQDYDMWMRIAKIVKVLQCTGKATYVQDESHDLGRTTAKSASVIEEAYLRCSNKHLSSGASRSDRLRLRLNYHSYPQVPLVAKELLEYMSAGIFIKPLYHYIKKKL